jgi:hypothetical protein
VPHAAAVVQYLTIQKGRSTPAAATPNVKPDKLSKLPPTAAAHLQLHLDCLPAQQVIQHVTQLAAQQTAVPVNLQRGCNAAAGAQIVALKHLHTTAPAAAAAPYASSKLLALLVQQFGCCSSCCQLLMLRLPSQLVA